MEEYGQGEFVLVQVVCVQRQNRMAVRDRSVLNPEGRRKRPPGEIISLRGFGAAARLPPARVHCRELAPRSSAIREQ